MSKIREQLSEHLLLVREDVVLKEGISQTARLKAIYDANISGKIGTKMSDTEDTKFGKNTKLIDRTTNTIIYGEYTGSGLFINEVNAAGRIVNKMTFKATGLKGLKSILK